MSSSTSCLEAHADFFRLVMRGILDPYYCHEGRKRHLQRPHFSKGLTKLAILPDYECPGLICLALPARRKFGLILVIKVFLVEVMKKSF